MKDVIPYIFWPWFGISCLILLRRRVSHGSWRPAPPKETVAPVEFPPLPPDDRPAPPAFERHSELPTPSTISTTSRPDADPPQEPEPDVAPSPVAVATPVDPDRPRSRSIAEAVEGIAMPCNLTPLMGAGEVNPREVAFFTTGPMPATVGSALADEFERLGYAITPLDDRSIRAERGHDVVEAALFSTELVSVDVMKERHPSAPADAVVVELKLT